MYALLFLISQICIWSYARESDTGTCSCSLPVLGGEQHILCVSVQLLCDALKNLGWEKYSIQFCEWVTCAWFRRRQIGSAFCHGRKHGEFPGFWTSRVEAERWCWTCACFSYSCAACRRWLLRCKPRWGWSLEMTKILNGWVHQVWLFWLVYSSYVRLSKWLLPVLHLGHAFMALLVKQSAVLVH